MVRRWVMLRVMAVSGKGGGYGGDRRAVGPGQAEGRELMEGLSRVWEVARLPREHRRKQSAITSRAADPKASDFLENALELRAAVLMVDQRPLRFTCNRISQIENNSQRKIETPSRLLLWDGYHPFEVRDELPFWIGAVFIAKASALLPH